MEHPSDKGVSQLIKKNMRTLNKSTLTYVCPRILAMSFPGEDFDTKYTENINQVSAFLRERHGDDYHIFNLSGQAYDINKFQGRVSSYAWGKRCPPPIQVLFEVARSINDFLAKKQSNVVVIHCLNGKGRTGTAICCYLLYSGRFAQAQHVIDYYMKKRFQQHAAVTLPTHIRYIQYFESLLNDWMKAPVVKYLSSITLVGIPIFSKHSCRPFIEVYSVQDNSPSLLYTDKKPHADQKKYQDLGNEELNIIKIQIDRPVILVGDIIIRFLHNGKFSSLYMFKASFNTAFLPEDNSIIFELQDLDPPKIAYDKRVPEYLSVEIKFSDFCECRNTDLFDSKCLDCAKYTQLVRKQWDPVHNIMKEYDKYTERESKILLFGDPDFDDLNEVLYASKTQMPNLKGEGLNDESESEEWVPECEKQQDAQEGADQIKSVLKSD